MLLWIILQLLIAYLSSNWPRNMACHNLLQHNSMPPGTTKLLGLGLNYCIKSTTTKETTTNTFNRLADDVRRIYAMGDVENDEDSYIPSLYIKSEYKFDKASVLIENALVSFEKAVQQKQQQLQHRRSKPTMKHQPPPLPGNKSRNRRRRR